LNTSGKRLKALRHKKDSSPTQKEVAQDIGVTRDTYANWENDRGEPSHVDLKELARYFCVSVENLLGFTNIRTPIETITAYRIDDSMADVPEEARKSLKEFKEYILKKYGKK
jgi:transcriptional regulator with XRE-family HTH domain